MPGFIVADTASHLVSRESFVGVLHPGSNAKNRGVPRWRRREGVSDSGEGNQKLCYSSLPSRNAFLFTSRAFRGTIRSRA
jgi:hypothetical protein